MLIDFFQKLRIAKVPVTIKELLERINVWDKKYGITSQKVTPWLKQRGLAQYNTCIKKLMTTQTLNLFRKFIEILEGTFDIDH